MAYRSRSNFAGLQMTDKKKTAPARAALQTTEQKNTSKRVNFKAINARALAALPSLLQRWLPDGKAIRGEWIALNPRRADNHPGSFKINMRSGLWRDFASRDSGGDVISLAAYLGGIRPIEAARNLAEMLGVSNG